MQIYANYGFMQIYREEIKIYARNLLLKEDENQMQLILCKIYWEYLI